MQAGLSGLLIGLSGVVVATTAAAESGRISGRIHQDGQGVAEHRIMLIRFGPEQEVHRTPGQTDPEGRFTFDELATGDTHTYFVGIRYRGQLHRSAPVRLAAGEHRQGVDVDVGSGTASTPRSSEDSVHIAQHLMVVVARGDNRLGVREIVRVRNPATGPEAEAMSVEDARLHLPLPQGFSGLEDFQGLDAQHMQLRPSGIYYTAPLPPGEHRLVYTYSLPFQDRVSTLVLERTLPTGRLDILVEDSQLVGASNLSFIGRASIEPHTFFHFRGAGLDAQSRVWLQLTRRHGSAPLLRVGAYGLIVGLVLLGVGGAASTLWRGRPRPPVAALTPEGLGELQVVYERLLRTVAHLDDAHAAGRLDPEDYTRQRQQYKQQLLDLSERLHRAGQTTERVASTAWRRS